VMDNDGIELDALKQFTCTEPKRRMPRALPRS
jgi:hypothetical protein